MYTGDEIEYRIFPDHREKVTKRNFQFKDLDLLGPDFFTMPAYIEDFINMYVTPFCLIFVNVILYSYAFILVYGMLKTFAMFLKKVLIALPLGIKLNSYVSDDFDSKYLFLIYISWLGFCLSYFYFTAVYIFLTEYFIYAVAFLITLKGLQLLFIPTKLLYEMGFFYIVFVKGSGVSKLVAWEYITDSISLLSYYLRAMIQLIRLVIVLALFFTYHEVYEHYNFAYNYQVWAQTTTLSFSNYSLSIIYFIKTLAHWFYECIHFVALFCVQYSVFTLVLLALISFLYLQKLTVSMEVSYTKLELKWINKLLTHLKTM